MPQKTQRKNESKIRIHDGEQLRRIRKFESLTQEEFAIKLNISVGSYGEYERGQKYLPRIVHWRVKHITGKDPFEREKRIARRAKQVNACHQIKSQQTSHWRRIIQSHQDLRINMPLFLSDRYSVGARRMLDLRFSVFSAASLYAFIRVNAIHMDLPFGTPIGNVDWVYITAFFTSVILLFFEVRTFWKFLGWYRAKSQKVSINADCCTAAKA